MTRTESAMTDGKRSLQVIVPARYDGGKVLKVLREELRVSGTLIKRLKHTQGILLNGCPARTVDVYKRQADEPPGKRRTEPDCGKAQKYEGNLKANLGILRVRTQKASSAFCTGYRCV